MALAVAAVLVAAAGCAKGGGRLTKAEYITRADAICREINEKGGEVSRPTGRDPEALAEYADKTIEFVEPRVERFKALKGPESDQASIDELNASFDRLISNLKGVAAAIRSGDREAGRKVTTELQMAIDKNRRLAKQYGFKECGR